MIPQQLVMFEYTAHGPEHGRGLAARDSRGRLVLADAAGNPGTSMTNAVENAVWPARELLGLGPEAEVYLYAADDPVEPHSVWRVHLGIQGADFEIVRGPDDDLRSVVAALARARGDES